MFLCVTSLTGVVIFRELCSDKISCCRITNNRHIFVAESILLFPLLIPFLKDDSLFLFLSDLDCRFESNLTNDGEMVCGFLEVMTGLAVTSLSSLKVVSRLLLSYSRFLTLIR